MAETGLITPGVAWVLCCNLSQGWSKTVMQNTDKEPMKLAVEGGVTLDIIIIIMRNFLKWPK